MPTKTLAAPFLDQVESERRRQEWCGVTRAEQVELR
ncbi:MAG: hypothetical protein RJA47_1650, partial [Actinomycetota bacterium]